MVEEKTFYFFWNEANPSNGLIQDRARNFTSSTYDMASIASIGFGLTAICVAHSRGWISYDEAYSRILTTLKTFRNGPVQDKNGFFYHFLNMDTGARYDIKSELSSIDTTLFLAGTLFAGQYFKGTEIETIADELYRAADWVWMSDDGAHEFVNMSWTPENPPPGFGSSYWRSFDEGVLLDVLAIGSPTHPKNTDCWRDMERPPGTYKDYTLIYCSPNNPLFVHQYPHIWIDFRRKEHNGTNYFENSREATLANRQYCIDHQDNVEDVDDDYTTYSSKCWGLTSGDAPVYPWYISYGAKPNDTINDDGTVQPTAAAGSIVFTPEESIEALKYMYDNYESFIWGNYGFCDGFNLDRSPDWWASDVIGISQGATMLAIENYRTGMVWDIFMQIPYVTDALNRMGFSDTGDNTPPEKIDLKVEKGSNTGEVVLEWTAPGDDENVGKATEYIIRYSEKEINNYARWYDAIDVTGEAVPKDAGRKETFSIKNLTPGKKYYFAIRAVDDIGNKSVLSNSPSFRPEREKSKLNQIYPNPFNPAKARNATISYNLSSAANVVIEIYNLTGERVEDWSEGCKPEGEHKTTWEGRNRAQKQVASGIYIVVLRENGIAVDRKKMAIIK